jgi:acyl carrier protein
MSEELTRRVISVIAETQKIPPEKITLDSTFEELNIDSLDGINLLFALENEFNVNIPDEGVQGLRGVREMIEALEKLLSGGPAEAGATAQP